MTSFGTCRVGHAPTECELSQSSSLLPAFSQHNHEVKMHVIDRRPNQALLIDGCIEVKILEVNDQTVRIGIKSPNETPPYREVTVNISENKAVLELLMNR